ncbi:MAG: hypothetical protein HY525_17375 [Betaproteobacteria bacterium]|nr:hypothetical protein [Betaproteobacteria bacterium]
MKEEVAVIPRLDPISAGARIGRAGVSKAAQIIRLLSHEASHIIRVLGHEVYFVVATSEITMTDQKNDSSTVSTAGGIEQLGRWVRRILCLLSFGFIYPMAWAEGIDIAKYEKESKK